MRPAQAAASLGEDALAALDVAPAIIRELDGTIRFWSTGAERLYGFTREQALGRVSHELLATRSRRPLADIQAALLADGEWHGELRHHAADGRTVVVASHWVLRPGALDQSARVVEISHDLGFQQAGMVAMRRLAAIVESSNDAIVGKDLDGIITHWNRAAEAMFGYRPEEILGLPVTQLFPPGSEAEEAAIMDRICRGDEIKSHRTLRRRRDGSIFPVSLTVSPILDEDGGIVGASKILRDLTEQFEQEARLHDAQAELFHVQRLTELGQLVTTLVHELNQPLAAIGNYAAAGRRLLLAGQTSGAGAAVVKIIEQTERAHQIVQRLRNFVKKSDIEHRAEDLPVIVRDAVALAGVSLSHPRAPVETRFDPAAAKVYGDRVQIQQVLFNLVRNALEAMEDAGQRDIVIAVAPAEEAGMVQVSVADTGPGLPAEVRTNLFRPFVTTKENGMGVGLSICRSIIEMHGGRMWADDNPGGGTVFRFTLQAAPSDDVIASL